VDYHDDDLRDYLAKLRPRRMVSLTCPDCPAVVNGLTGEHAAELLAIHQEGTCQGARGGERR
jgi:hypothetical protein